MQCQCLSVVECVRAKYPYYHSKFLRTEQTATTSRGSLALKPEHYARLIDMLSELQGATSFSITCTDRLMSLRMRIEPVWYRQVLLQYGIRIKLLLCWTRATHTV